MIRVALIGSTGYTALEVARLLLNHPGAELTLATSRSDEGKPLSEIHPSLAGRCDLALQPFDPIEIAKSADVAMCCLPHGASAQSVKELAQAGMRVIDFSADFRLSRVDLYERWYDVKHPWPERVGNTVYGMPEFFADEIANADIVANPGCYPTSAIMPLAPLIKAGLIEPVDIIVDAKSGVSGAGRSPKLGTLYCEANEQIAAYSVACHRHGPEMQDLIQRISDREVEILFTPHLTPMDRGILATIYAIPTQAAGSSPESIESRLMEVLRETYQNEPFIHVVDHLPSTKHVAMTNHVQMTVRSSGTDDRIGRVVLVCAIDNLTKGASGAAVQNMNVMFGVDQQAGL